MKNKKILNDELEKMGDSAFWKEFRDRDVNVEDRYIVVDKDGSVSVFNGKLVRKKKTIVV